MTDESYQISPQTRYKVAAYKKTHGTLFFNEFAEKGADMGSCNKNS